MMEGAEDEMRTPRDMSKRHIRILHDTLNLIENSKTEFFAAKYSLGINIKIFA